VVQSQLGQIVYEILSQKYPTQKRTAGVIQVVEHLPNKSEVLSSNASTAGGEKNMYHTSKYISNFCINKS
jgi:hypothetical protein